MDIGAKIAQRNLLGAEKMQSLNERAKSRGRFCYQRRESCVDRSGFAESVGHLELSTRSWTRAMDLKISGAAALDQRECHVQVKVRITGELETCNT